MTHIGGRVFVAFDDRYVNMFMGPTAQKHTIDDLNGDNFDHSGLGFILGAQVSVQGPGFDAGPIAASVGMQPPRGIPNWGAPYRKFIAKYFARHAALNAQTDNLPFADQMIDLDPDVRDAWGLPAPRLTYDWRRPSERARVEYMLHKTEEIGRAMGATHVWRANERPGSPGGHHQGGARMGSDSKNSVVNRYGQSWDIHNLFIAGGSIHPTISGFNPTLTMQALAYMTADAIVNRYSKNRGPLV
jgi:gluconate 2-dehydrogenase alpha chain